MPKATQLTVSLENRPGTLAHLAKVLGDAKVNIVAFNATTAGYEGTVHLVVDNVARAKEALGAARIAYTEREVLQVAFPNRPGALGRSAGKLAARDINITWGYQTSVKGSKKASLVLAVSDLEKAARVR